MDLVWAKVLTTPGVRHELLPTKPAVIDVEDVLIAPLLGPDAAIIQASMLQAMGVVDRLREYPVAVLQIGRWFAELQDSWI
jgi:hypothetical protein